MHSPNGVLSLAGFEKKLAKRFIASPAVDVIEGDKAYEITAELPGLDEKNIEVSVANGGLTIKGEKKEEREETQKDYYVSERSYGSFSRAIALPYQPDSAKVEAKFDTGVLRVHLPKPPGRQQTAEDRNPER